MKALQFLTDPEPWPTPVGPEDPVLLQHLATTPMALVDLPDPQPLADDWLVMRPRLTGICGSDSKQVLMDFEDGGDNMMTAFISFPQVLGHEVVATVEEAGPAVDTVEPGQRVLLFPNIGCRARGLSPICPACERGDYSICQRWWEGTLSPGIHTGNAVEATGGFAELMPAHTSMTFPIPDAVPDELAVLADPWSVSFHAITRNPPQPGQRVLIIGAGALGTTASAILTGLYDCEVGVVARWPAQADVARRRGVASVFDPDPPEALVEALAAWSGAPLRRPWEGLPVCYPGQIDIVYDTVGSASTVEVAMRVLAERGTLVQMGVSSPARFEWTPWYFKELRLIGSNAFGDETFDGRTAHAYEHFFDLVGGGSVDLSGMLTHTFPLEEWREAFTTIVDAQHTGAIKVAFDQRQP